MYYKMFVQELVFTAVPILIVLGIVGIRIACDKIFTNIEDILYNEGSLPLVREIMKDDHIVRILSDSSLDDWQIWTELQKLGLGMLAEPRSSFVGKVIDEEVRCFFEKGVIKAKVLRPETKRSLKAAVDYFIASRPWKQMCFKPKIVFLE